jgi:hypothetical protein
MSQTTRIAVLLFSRTPRAEALHKQWLPRRRRANTALARLLWRQSRQLAASGPFPVFRISERQQRGNTFGQRFADAFRQVFDAGFDAVISIGADAAHPGPLPWRRMAEALSQGHAVAGPDLRGGAYLIGLTRGQFDAQALAGLPWQSAQVWDALGQYAATRRSGLLALPARPDLNGPSDLKALATSPWLSSYSSPLLAQVAQWLAALPKPHSFSGALPSSPAPAACRVRPPPSCLLTAFP